MAFKPPFMFFVFKLHFSGCLKLCFLLCSLIYLLPSCDYWSLSRPCTWSPMLSCQAKSMAQELEGPLDVSVMLGCLLAALGGLQCEVSPSLGFTFSSNMVNNILLAK